MDLVKGIEALTVIAAVAALAPFVSMLVPGNRLPQSVVMILGGVLIGSHGLALADRSEIRLFENIGLAFLFLLAGYEIDLSLLPEPASRLALVGWLTSAMVAAGIVAILEWLGIVHAFVPVSLALTTTALGTLLPIVREAGLLEGAFGRFLLAAGTAGEILPIIGMAIFLGANDRIAATLSVVAIGGLATVLTLAPRLARQLAPRLRLWPRRPPSGETAQPLLRWTVVLLLVLVDAAAETGLDIVLGAFLAGVVLRRWRPEGEGDFSRRLDAVAYGLFIPIFLIASGMDLDVPAVVHHPLRVLLFVTLLLVVRGLPTLVIYRNKLRLRDRAALTFLTATALPLLVALTEIGLRSRTMAPENAASIVGAGLLSVLVFPPIAASLASPPQRR